MANRITNSKPTTSFVWMIENFSYWYNGIYGDSISSPWFSCSGLVSETFSLRLFPSGIHSRGKPFRVQLQPHGLFSVLVADCVLSYLDENNTIVAAFPAQDQVIRRNEAFYMPPYITDNEVERIRESISLPLDVLRLKFDIIKKDKSSSLLKKYFANTRFEMRKTKYNWPKDYFLQFVQNASIPLLINMFQDARMSLKCRLNVEVSPIQSFVVRFEALRLEDDTTLLVTLKISLVNELKETVEYKEEKCALSRENNVYNFQLPSFVTRQDLIETHHFEFLVSVFCSFGVTERIVVTALYPVGCEEESFQPSWQPIRDPNEIRQRFEATFRK